ncbi:TPA: hypothetical protein NIB84_005504 [Pseudomonas aeruginosa]|jgi:hypothetical protein|uniref:hypothetical protein n=1 Tax=Pseudomonadaceae TaxID=135621 RepID=UPI001152988E|nr:MULTISPECIES: hypothetical protein [Pseudomonas aeruginosa group]MEE1950789.1 hypothetical protein [Pseudomonas alcaligenes]TQI06913.1 hypothetical protein FLI94_29015 [Pseudomonas aeruginosa]HCE7213221.1 hypothetical protein [Pseudomonas aeruginosa]HCE7551246.1 hypothetical protein [Pseudomonas aeruginosa]HCE7578273.1 hypothetical protein [Pseudomonas aeruginosa]
MPRSSSINSSDVHTFVELLRAICRTPATFANSTKIKIALHSQAGLAALEHQFEENDIYKTTKPMSLNTLKSYANTELDRGFRGLNDLRIAAADAIQSYETRCKASNKRTKSGLTIRTSELEKDIELLRKANLILLQAVALAITDINTIRDTKDSSLREKRANESLQTLRAIVSLNPPPFDLYPNNSSVVVLADYK